MFDFILVCVDNVEYVWPIALMTVGVFLCVGGRLQ